MLVCLIVGLNSKPVASMNFPRSVYDLIKWLGSGG